MTPAAPPHPPCHTPTVNETFAALGLLHWKPVLSALLLPPVPLLVLLLVGLRLRRGAPAWAALVVLLSLAGLWLSHCSATGQWIERRLVQPPPAISAERLTQWRASLGAQQAVVVVLGGGSDRLAPEYGQADLSLDSSQRLRYGLWLSRQLGNVPVMFSGGVGLGAQGGAAEAQIAQRVAERDHGRSLRWTESVSRDTRDNARQSLTLLADDAQGRQLLGHAKGSLFLVTHGWHMPRALRAFEAEAARRQLIARIVPASMGLGEPAESTALRWLPSVEGYRRVSRNLHELIGLLAGA